MKEGSTDPYSPVTIILDQKPKLAIDVINGGSEKGQVVTVRGLAKDEDLDKVIMNGKEAEVDS